MMYTIFLGKYIHLRSGKKLVSSIQASDPEKEKKVAFHGGGLICFLPCLRNQLQEPFSALLQESCHMTTIRVHLERPPIINDLDGPIHVNRFTAPREAGHSRELSQGSRSESLFCESSFGALKVANRGFQAVRANRSNVIMKIGIFLSANRFTRINSCESPRFALRITGPSKINSITNRHKGNCYAVAPKHFHKGSLRVISGCQESHQTVRNLEKGALERKRYLHRIVQDL